VRFILTRTTRSWKDPVAQRMQFPLSGVEVQASPRTGIRWQMTEPVLTEESYAM